MSIRIISQTGSVIGSVYDRVDYMYFITEHLRENHKPLMVLKDGAATFNGYIKGRSKIIYIGEGNNFEIDRIQGFIHFGRALLAEDTYFKLDADFIFYDKPYLEVVECIAGRTEVLGIVFSKEEMINLVERETGSKLELKPRG